MLAGLVSQVAGVRPTTWSPTETVAPAGSLSSCPTPTPEMLKAVELHLVPKSAEHRTSDGIPWPQIFGHYLDQCQTIHDTIKDVVKSSGLKMPQVAMPLRHIVTGRAQTPSIDAVLELLGREVVLTRLARYMETD